MIATLIRHLLFILLLSSFTGLYSQSLYWVGGSGNWNDPSHWSLSSGGNSANQVPSSNTDAIFDDNSFTGSLVVNIVGTNQVRSIKGSNLRSPIFFTGISFSELHISGDFVLDRNLNFNTNSTLYFSSTSLTNNDVSFGGQTLNSNVVFQDGNWNIKNLSIGNSSSISFLKGNYNFNSSSLTTGNLIADADNINFNINGGIFDVKNNFEIGNKTNFNSTNFYLKARKSDPNNFKVKTGVSFGANSKILDATMAVCGATLTSVGVSCSGICDGKLILKIDATCVPPPFTLLWSNPSCPTPTLTGVPAGTYTINGLCQCADFFSVIVFDGIGNVLAISNATNIAGASAIQFLPTAFIQPKCNGQCNGAIKAILSGGVAPYTVYLNPPGGATFVAVPSGPIQTFTNLCSGLQTFSVVDANNCSKTFTFNLSQPSALASGGSTQSITCNAVCNGSVMISPGNTGTPGYTVNWSTGASVAIGAFGTSSLTGLCPGPITATVTDANGCTITYVTNIVQPTPITVTPTQTNVSCGGFCDATASVMVSGGTPGYTYTWNPGPGNASSLSNLCAGNQTVTITDLNGCQKKQNFVITQPPPITLTPTFTNITCNGLCNGSAAAGQSGGTPPFTFTWTAAGPVNIAFTNTVSGLCIGIYTVSVKDASLCPLSATVQITQPPAITLSVNSTSVTCFGLCNGSATAVVGGGTPGYTYTWSPAGSIPVGQGTGTVSSLCTGNYSVQVKDSKGCPANTTFTITQPSVISQNVTTTSVTCSGLCNGIISSAPSGGTGPYTFTLSSATTTLVTPPPYGSLCAGIYSLTVKDANSCSITQTINLAQPNTLTLSVNSTSISCFGNCNASLAGSILGGTPPYTYTWTNSVPTTFTTPVINGQCAGSFTFASTDNNGCTTSSVVTVISPSDMTVTIGQTLPKCNGSCNGALSATVTGGTPAYTYNWSSPGSITSSMSNLCAGNYTLTVTDNKGCIKTTTTSLSNPPPIVISTTAIPTNCAGSCDGQANANASGGTPGYTYQWNTIPVTNGPNAINLCNGNYVVKVTDANGCINSQNVIITSPPLLTAAITGIKPSCNVCIGAATVTAGGGTAPYTYTWTPSGGNASTASNLCVGSYTVKITDAKGCTATATVGIVQSVVVILTTNGTTLQCNGGCTGIASANAAGGLAPYTYTWTNSIPAVISNTNVVNNLCAGAYTVVVQDANLCSNTATINFTNPAAINAAVTFTNVKCNGSCNGAINVVANGGTGALTYSWSPGNPTGQGTPNVSNLCAGVYSLDIKDANNCVKQITVNITQPPVLTATFSATSPLTCGGVNGSIVATASGGTPAYGYTWTPPGVAGTATLSGIGAGTYSLTIKDAVGCSTTMVTTLSDPTGPTVTVTSNSITCNGLCNGSATVSAIGTAPLSYSWAAPISSTATTVSGLCQGTFVVNVRDGSNCLVSQTLSISQPPTFSLNPSFLSPTCNGACSGSITTAPAGGTPAYSYTWTPGGANSQSLNNICAGNYTVNVKDANNCAYSQTFTLIQPSSVTVTFNQSNVKCNGMCNGAVKAVVNGGTAPYTYTWTPIGAFPGSPIDTIVNLCANIYTVTVKDANNCTTTATVQITEPPVLTSTIVVKNVTCNGQCNGVATILVGGGTPAYAYSWNTGPTTNTIGGLCAGNYTGTVTDSKGCVLAKAITVTQPGLMSVTLTPTNPKCNGVCNGSITSNVVGGTGAYTYSWIPAGGIASSATNLCSGSYTLIVKDDSLCTGQNVTVLTNPAALLANVSFTNPSCNATCNGSAISNPANGTAPFTYTWTTAPVQNTQLATNICAGTFTLFVQDNNGCRDTQQVVLTSPSTLTINPAVASAACGVCNGSITAFALGGVPAYSYTWSPAVSVTSSATNLCAGIYTVTVKDANNCVSVFQIPLSNSNGPSGSTNTFTNVTCNGLCNGAVSVTNPVGGTPPYNIVWVTPATTVNPVTNLCAGTYTAKITDAAGCILFQSVPVNQPAVLNASTTVKQPLCNGICNGTITSTPSGGNPGYTYNWSTGASTSSITGVCPGNYTLTVTDTKACVATQTFNILGTTSITGNTVAVNNNCFGNCNGSLLAAAVAGGLPPYSFNWSDPLGQSTAQATGLCNGNYFVIIKDNQGCFDTLKGTIASPPAITLNSAVTQPTCGLCNGSSTVSALGGTAPYTYTWSSAATGTVATNLCAGLYMVTITDGAGCAQNVSVTINNSSTLSQTITSTNETCFGMCNGTASVTASGGTPGYTYNWIMPAATTNTLNGLCGGTYFVQVKDAVGCINTNSVTIVPATSLSVTPFISQPGCGVNNGTISVTVTGGGGPITYAWAPVAGATATLTGLGVGSYTLTVSDGTCNKVSVFNLTNQNAPTLNIAQSDVSCNSFCNGIASLTVTSGVAPYTFNWSSGTVASGATNSSSSLLCNGLVTATVTGANGCKIIKTFNLSQPLPIVTSLPNLVTPKCNNDCNGAITVVPSGGTLPYNFVWSPAGNTNPIINLCSGNYSVTITDANGCNIVRTYTLINPPPFGLTANVVNSSCNTVADGAITTTVTGGVPTYTYSWTGPGTFTSNASSLPNILSGTYSLSLVDFAGCRKDTTMKVLSTVSVVANAGRDTSFCQGGNYLLNGSLSSGGITYQWFQLPNPAPISNTLTVLVTPAIGTSTFVLVATNGSCVSRDTVKLTSNIPPVVNAGPNILMPIYSSTVIGGAPTGPAGCTFTWSPAGTLNNPNISNPVASNTLNTTYTVTVTDVNGCRGSDTMHVFIYPQIFIPNGFSPNTDGKNDFWVIDNIQQFTDCTVEIFNRWGEPLFYSKGYTNLWDGKYKGKDLPVGTYYYVINLNHPAFPTPYTGPLTIFR